MLRVILSRPAVPAALAAALLCALAAPASASDCEEGAKYFAEQQKLMGQLNSSAVKDKQIEPRAACPILRKMVSNGEAGAKWLEGNKDWCGVPPQVAENFTGSLGQIKQLRGKACEAAAKVVEMEKQARQQSQRGGLGSLGGGALTSDFKIPQGAL